MRKRSASTLQQASSIAPKSPNEAAGNGTPAGKLKSGTKVKPELGPDANGGGIKPRKAGGTESLFAAFLALAQSSQNKESSTQKLKDKSLLGRLAGSAAKGLGVARGKAGAQAVLVQARPQTSAADTLVGRAEAEAARSAAELEAVKASAKTKGLEAGNKAQKDGEASEGKSDKPRENAKPTSTGRAGIESLLVSSREGLKPMTLQRPKGGEAQAGKAEGLEGEGKASPSPKLSVTDLRKSHEKGREKGQVEGPGAAVQAEANAGPGARVAELDLDLSGAAGIKGSEGWSDTSGGGAASGKAEASPSREFTSVLTEQLKATWNGDIVKTAQIVLKDGDAGLIRLRLHPESLGGVKIELKLADNSISGKIVVESNEAKTAFEKNMAQLQDAFRQGGFESAKLEVQVGSGQSGGAGGQSGEADKPFWSERLGLERLASAVPESGSAQWTGRARQAVDILA